MIKQSVIEQLVAKYKFIDVIVGYVLIIKLDSEIGKESSKSVLSVAGLREERPLGYVLQSDPDNKLILEPGDMVIYNEFEGQELEKTNDLVTDDGLVIMPVECIVARINNTTSEIYEPESK